MVFKSFQPEFLVCLDLSLFIDWAYKTCQTQECPLKNRHYSYSLSFSPLPLVLTDSWSPWTRWDFTCATVSPPTQTLTVYSPPPFGQLLSDLIGWKVDRYGADVKLQLNTDRSNEIVMREQTEEYFFFFYRLWASNKFTFLLTHNQAVNYSQSENDITTSKATALVLCNPNVKHA